MSTKYGGSPAGVMQPDEVTLTSNRQPDAASCSATNTANGAPMAHPHHTDLSTVQIEAPQGGVVAGPARVLLGRPAAHQEPHDVTVGIEQADLRNRHLGPAPLPATLPQQVLGPEDRRLPVVLGLQEWDVVLGHALQPDYFELDAFAAPTGRGCRQHVTPTCG